MLYPLHGRDLVDAAVIARMAIEQDIEALRPVVCPLDVLAQVIVSMTGLDTWDIDALYAFLRTSWPYHGLTRTQFDLVLDMLAGRYRARRVRELDARVSVDRIDNTVKCGRGSLRVLYSSGGTIPDRGYFNLRRADSQDQDRRTRRGIRVGAAAGPDLRPRDAVVAHPRHHAQRCACRARDPADSGRALLARRGNRPRLPFHGGRGAVS